MSVSIVFHKNSLDFIHQGLSITAASRDARLIPSISKALACRVLPQSREICIFVNQLQAGRLLSDVASSQRIAVTYCLPSSHKTIQIKGKAARQVPLQPGDPDYCLHYTLRLARDLESMGYNPATVARYLHVDAEQLAVIRFQPDSVYEQSPGEKAGEPMEWSRC